MNRSSFDTKVVHSKLNQEHVLNSKTTPIYQTSAFTFKDLDHLESYYEGDSPYLYTREKNPNTDELGQTVASLEEAEAGIATSSGMSAILAGILAVAKPGDHIVAAEDLYGGTHNLITNELRTFGIEVSVISFADPSQIRAAINQNTKLLYTESISNPFLRVEDLSGLVEIASEHGIKTMVDNTFATPYLLQPCSLGVDMVVHSATKYIGGHSDVTAGILVGSRTLVQQAKQKVVALGSNLSPFEAWLAQRGAKTLALRMKQQSYNAEKLAQDLQQNKHMKKVYYPEFVSKQGQGAVVTIELDHQINIEQFFKSLGWIKIVPSLAGVETTVSYPIKTSHRTLSSQELENLGINAYVVRLSVGIEDSQDIIDQVSKAIEDSV